MLFFVGKLTSRIWIDLPVVIKWPACQHDRKKTGDKRRDDQSESNQNLVAVALAEAVLSSSISFSSLYFFSD